MAQALREAGLRRGVDRKSRVSGGEVWEKAYSQKIGPAGRALVGCLSLLGGTLKASFLPFCSWSYRAKSKR